MTWKTPFASSPDLWEKTPGGIFGVIYYAPTYPMIAIYGLAQQHFEERERNYINTRLENPRLDQRPGWAFYSAVFCISYEAESISGATENAGKVPVTRVLGIKLAPVQRHWVVSYLLCICIICQCEEVFATKKEEREKKGKKISLSSIISYEWESSRHTSPERYFWAINVCPLAFDFLPSLLITSLLSYEWCGL